MVRRKIEHVGYDRMGTMRYGLTLAKRVMGLGLALSGLALGGTAPAMAGDIYVFERGHAAILFSWNHLGLSRQTGRFTDYEGSLELDVDNPEASRLDVRIKAASLATGFDALDRQLKTADYFNVAAHPALTFQSTAVKRTGDKTADVTGDLTILGVTKPVTLAVVLNFAGTHPLGDINPAYRERRAAGFGATARIKRSDWGMDRATPLVSDEIEIAIESEFLKKN